MRISLNPKFFWYFKEGSEFDTSDSAMLDMYVQQMMMKGRMEDIRQLIRQLGLTTLGETFGRIQRFLPRDVKWFWEDFLGDS